MRPLLFPLYVGRAILTGRSVWEGYYQGKFRFLWFITFIRICNRKLLSYIEPFYRDWAGYRNNWRNSTRRNYEILTSTITMLGTPSGWLSEFTFNWPRYLKKLSNCFIYTNVPIFMHRIASHTEKNIKKQSETSERSFFLHSYFELTWVEIRKGRVEVHLTFVS